MVAPAATRITAPSPISAVLSATATSLARRKLAEMPRPARIAVGERIGERSRSTSPASSAASVGQFRHERAVDENEPPRLDVAEQRAGASWRAPWPPHRAAPRAAWRRASARAGRCISSPRRGDAAGPSRRTRRTRRSRCAATAPPGSRAARLRKRLRQRGLRRGLDQLSVQPWHQSLRACRERAHAAASS